MLDRLFRRLGYVPVSSLNLTPYETASHSPAVAPHRHRASAFEFGRAKLDGLCYLYCDGDFSHLAVGRDDWAPLAVAGFSLSSQPQCRAWLNENLRSRVWVGNEALQSWHAENRPVFAKVGSRPNRQFVSPMNLAMLTDNGEKDQVPMLEASEIAELFALAWQRARVASPFFFPVNSAQYAALLGHHALRFACEANEHALERAIDWLATWFESRGLAVDREQLLVNLPGYGALFCRAPASLSGRHSDRR
ncbi:hypothetical protein BTH42_33880 [Burkholderia sp. SRS-W-2-2016]|uniref:hypothetical protein n=1 Tax=Burkholderia sp. SRS-W-2-2016 TaxID=1926878 RepID=UPI00094AC299|nr:hypothetical protein [Burkholderia sp. SRS-W-2-2016]OLL27235.1 hypothetical protein BTH42_33880 [Burkholderia sp. SRS-W-2-2016]